jgi:hypothetical protein
MFRHLGWALALAGMLAAGPAAGEEGDSKGKGKKKDILPQRELNYGYASLYNAAKGLRHSDKILLIKFESEAVQAVMSKLSESMGRIAQRLEELAKGDPRVKLDNDGQTEIENRKRDAVTRARLLSFKPITGRTGANFERTLLLSESGALNQLQHLVAELDKADPDPQRSAVLKEIHAEVSGLYDDVVDLLNRQYFK